MGTASLDEFGVELVTAAFGQPQTCWLLREFVSGPEYSGSARFSLVARQLRIVKGESMEISKWRLFASGFSSSFLDIRITI